MAALDVGVDHDPADALEAGVDRAFEGVDEQAPVGGHGGVVAVEDQVAAASIFEIEDRAEARDHLGGAAGDPAQRALVARGDEVERGPLGAMELGETLACQKWMATVPRSFRNRFAAI